MQGFIQIKINKDSYITFLGSHPFPIIVMILNKNESRKASHILVMYLESLSASGILIPKWHKRRAYKNVSLIPQIGEDFKEFSFVFRIK